MPHRIKPAITLAASLSLAGALGGVAEPVSAQDDPSYEEILRLLQEQQEKLAQQDRRLSKQQEQIRALRRLVLTPSIDGSGILDQTRNGSSTGHVADPSEPESRLLFVQDTEGTAPQAPVPPKEPQEPAAQPDAERPEAEKPTDQLLVERGGVLLPQGTLQIEPSVEYTHISSDRVAISGFTIFDAIVIGNIRVDDLERDIVTGTLTARYGLTDRIQLETRVPGVYRRDEEILGVGTNDERTRTIDGVGLGDVEASAAWQPLAQMEYIPATILRIRSRFPTGRHPFEIDREQVAPGEQRLTETPTGSGFYAVGPGATFVWRADPAVLFTGGSYTHNFERSFSGFGEIKPGDTFEWFAGLNLALSETVSTNLSFINQITGETQQGGRDRPGTSSNDARLVLGSSIGLSPSTSLIVSAGAGLTDESPDFTFTVSLPITIGVFE